MRIINIVRGAMLAAVCLVGNQTFAQTSGTQTYRVTVPTSISITAPTEAVLTHDQSNNPQAFPAQSWIVRGNSRNGVTVNFTTATPFVHTEDSSFKRDASLALAVGSKQGPAEWTVTVPTDASDYANSENTATVTATSDGVGRANLNLSVSFLTNSFDEFAAGTYTTVVTGTVAAN